MSTAIGPRQSCLIPSSQPPYKGTDVQTETADTSQRSSASIKWSGLTGITVPIINMSFHTVFSAKGFFKVGTGPTHVTSLTAKCKVRITSNVPRLHRLTNSYNFSLFKLHRRHHRSPHHRHHHHHHHRHLPPQFYCFKQPPP